MIALKTKQNQRKETFMTKTVLGIMGGSGVYDMPGLENAEWRKVNSPWGEPSDHILFATLHELELRFLPRHGRAHQHSPSTINYRANIDAMKRAGVTDLVSISACGSFREDMPPGTFVIVDQFIDRTFAREKSFFGAGCVAHVSLAHPVSPLLAEVAAEAAKQANIPYKMGGTYLCMEGPQFSTIAESKMYRAWGCDVIGMTNMPEAKLAREAELSYASIAMVTDFDSWHEEHGAVDISAIIATLKGNTANAQKLVAELARLMPKEHPKCPIGSDTALEFAIMTKPEMRDPELLEKLAVVAGRVLKGDAS